LAGAVGISGGSAWWIPNLLMPQPGLAKAMLHMKDAHFSGERNIDGVACTGVVGRDIQGDLNTIWVEKERKLIRSIEFERQIQDIRVNTTITYKPDINVDIPKEKFELNIPANADK
jgi:outer membrane lipoprotein-sorting protein